jgi:hypothetical protein
MTMGSPRFFRALAERKLFSSPSTDFLADAFEGNAFTGIDLSRGFIEARASNAASSASDIIGSSFD